MFERYNQPVISRREFVRRVVRTILVAVALLVIPLAIGVIGYMGLAGLSPVDAFLNASMILGGMGPVDPLPTDGAKIFAGTYALFAGIFFLVVAGVVLAPFLHRLLHRLHLAESDSQDSSSS